MPELWRSIINIKPFSLAMPGAFAPSNKELLSLKEDLIGLQKEFIKIKSDVYFIHGDKDSWVPIENINF